MSQYNKKIPLLEKNIVFLKGKTKGEIVWAYIKKGVIVLDYLAHLINFQ